LQLPSRKIREDAPLEGLAPEPAAAEAARPAPVAGISLRAMCKNFPGNAPGGEIPLLGGEETRKGLAHVLAAPQGGIDIASQHIAAPGADIVQGCRSPRNLRGEEIAVVERRFGGLEADRRRAQGKGLVGRRATGVDEQFGRHQPGHGWATADERNILKPRQLRRVGLCLLRRMRPQDEALAGKAFRQPANDARRGGDVGRLEFLHIGDESAILWIVFIQSPIAVKRPDELFRRGLGGIGQAGIGVVEDKAAMFAADGFGLTGIMGAQFWPQQIPARISGDDVFVRMLGKFLRHGLPVGLAQAEDQIAILQRLRRHPAQAAAAFAKPGHFLVDGADHVPGRLRPLHGASIARRQGLEQPAPARTDLDILLQDPFLPENDIRAGSRHMQGDQEPRIHLPRGDFHGHVEILFHGKCLFGVRIAFFDKICEIVLSNAAQAPSLGIWIYLSNSLRRV